MSDKNWTGKLGDNCQILSNEFAKKMSPNRIYLEKDVMQQFSPHHKYVLLQVL